MKSAVQPRQRFSAKRPCPVCGGHAHLPQGQSVRCFGFRSDDGQYAHCTREEYAGTLSPGDSGAYGHRLVGDCRCGARHSSPRPASLATPTSNGRAPHVGQSRRSRYVIRDGDGEQLAVHGRVDLSRPDGTPTKRMWWEPRGVRANELPLYRLPELLAAPAGEVVVVTEGEKACDALRARDVLAVGTVTGAASIPCDESLRLLVGRSVRLWPDADEPGERHMTRLGDRLRALGCVDVRVVRWAEAPHSGDAADFTGSDEELLALLEAAAPWDLASEGDHRPGKMITPNGDRLRSDVITFGSRIVRLSDVEPEEVSWLWPGRIALGKLTLLDGDPGQLKSTIALDIAARVTTGRPMPDDTTGVEGGVVLMTFEDGLADTVRPRLDAAGADASRVVALQGVGTGDDERLPAIPEDLDALRTAIAAVGAVLVIVDPLMAALTGEVNSHRDQDVRRALAPLARLAEELGVAVVVVRHLNKGQGQRALYRGGGSIAIGGAARAVFLAADDPDVEGEHILAAVKINITVAPPAMRYRPVEAENGTVAVDWLGTSAHKADALLDQPGSSEERSAQDEAIDFLSDLLAEGAVASATVMKAANAAGIATPTLRRAKGRMGVLVVKAGMVGGWSWVLPEGDHAREKMIASRDDRLRARSK